MTELYDLIFIKNSLKVSFTSFLFKLVLEITKKMFIYQTVFAFVVMFQIVLCNKSPPEEIVDSMPSHQSMYYWPKQYGTTHQLPVHSMDPYEHTEVVPTVSTQKFARKSSSLTPSMLMFSTVPSLAVSVLTFPMTLSKFISHYHARQFFQMHRFLFIFLLF